MKKVKIYSRIGRDGERISTSSFKDSATLNLTEEQLSHVKSLPIHAHDTVQDIDNGEIYEWWEVLLGSSEKKYGRLMYCPKTDILRNQTMGEFYGNCIVD